MRKDGIAMGSCFAIMIAIDEEKLSLERGSVNTFGGASFGCHSSAKVLGIGWATTSRQLSHWEALRHTDEAK